MSSGMNLLTPQDCQEPMVYDDRDPDRLPRGAVETWQDIAARYRAGHRGSASVLSAVEELLLELGDALAHRAARESADGNLALARRTLRFESHVNELYRLAETAPQAQMATTVLHAATPQWLFEGEDGTAWQQEIAALTDYAAWACADAS